MIKILKNNSLNILIAAVFFFSQVINVHANYLKNHSQRESIAASVMEQGKKKVANITSLFAVPNFTSEAKNESILEGKIENVFEPITLGFFSTVGALGFGFITGTIMAIFTGIIGWAIGKVKK
ncbi:hypothetical protein [Bartonella acomydis]|uniref:Protein-disulfide reductase n=1 Tax=Bartonella acomydis TaxID=686234 RepID=A0ABP9MR78_9HYPH